MKTQSSFEIILVSLRSSFNDEGTLSFRAREKTMERVDWRPQKHRFQQREKTLRGRVLVVTALTKEENERKSPMAR